VPTRTDKAPEEKSAKFKEQGIRASSCRKETNMVS
jgi:hypothetical protein